MRGPESKTQDAVIKYAREKYNALCKKNEVGRYFVGSGFPDYTIFPDRRRKKKAEVFLIEFKAPDKDFTDLQRERAKELRERGYRVYLVDDRVRGKKIIDKECK